MAEFRTVRVAAVQATPVILDAAATVEKAVGLIEEAAADRAELVVLPETFVPLYPSGGWAKAAAAFEGFDESLGAALVELGRGTGAAGRPASRGLRGAGVHCAIGINERELERPGTIYNSLLLIGPEGVLSKHRKLMPTHHERLFHGIGTGGDLDAVATPLGKIGGLICWENRMPLARYAVYRSGPQIWLAPTADDSDGWLASMRHIAIESGAYAVSVPQYIPRSAFPDDFPVELPDTEVFGRGGAAIIEPTEGNVIAGPLCTTRRASSTADCDLRIGLHAKRWFDSVGPLQPRGRAAAEIGLSLARGPPAPSPFRTDRARTRGRPPPPHRPARTRPAEAPRSRRSPGAFPRGNPEPQGSRGRDARSAARCPCRRPGTCRPPPDHLEPLVLAGAVDAVLCLEFLSRWRRCGLLGKRSEDRAHQFVQPGARRRGNTQAPRLHPDAMALRATRRPAGRPPPPERDRPSRAR